MTPYPVRTPLGVFLIATIPAVLGATPPTAANFSNLPLAFEENRGQVDPSAKFFARGEGYGVLVAQDGVTLTSPSGQVRMTLLGAEPSQSVGRSMLPGKVNYFAGNDSSKWLSNLDTYGEVVNHDVYRGIDVVYYGRQKRLEYDFKIAAGADPNPIRMRISGAGRAAVDPSGDLTVGAGEKELRWHKPVAYQAWGNDKRVVECSYVVDAEGIVFVPHG